MSRFDRSFIRHLDDLSRRGLRREPLALVPEAPGRVIAAGRSLVDFASNDYLGLARHPALIERARLWAEAGTGARASRLVTGTLPGHAAIEAKLARLKRTEAALLFNSGWQANASILPALLDRTVLGAAPLVFADRLIHASLHHGCAAAGIRPTRFRHNDLGHLDGLLCAADLDRPTFIITESVFSMDGDRADLAALADLADRHRAFLFVDEAHATGLFGPEGGGLSTLLPAGRIDLVMGTLSKALGGFGAYVAGSAALCAYLANRASGFIYATALPPAVLGAADAAIDLLPTLDPARERVQELANRLRTSLAARGIATDPSTTQIVPAIVGAPADALTVAERLREDGMLAVAIRPPTVPPGTARLRLALSAAHAEADVDRLADALDRHWPAEAPRR